MSATGHAMLSPSSAYRWTQCPASAAIAQANPSPSSFYADEGTVAHALAEWVLRTDGDPHARVGEVVRVPGRLTPDKTREITIDADMADYVIGYVERCRAASSFEGAVVLVERAVPIDDVTGEVGATGTADYLVALPRADGTYDVVVRDLKYGQGKMVEAQGNLQLAMYAHGACVDLSMLVDLTDDTVVTMTIDQPRRKSVSTWGLTLAQLREVIEGIRQAAVPALAAGVDGPRKAGAWCDFCPIRAACQERAAWVAGQLSAETGAEGFEMQEQEQGQEQKEDDLAANLERVAALREAAEQALAWCADVEREATERLARGEPVEGYKLVAGKPGNRRWEDEAKVPGLLGDLGLLEDDIYEPRKVRSPAQVEKRLDKDARPVVASLTVKPKGKPRLARADDPAPAWVDDETGNEGF